MKHFSWLFFIGIILLVGCVGEIERLKESIPEDLSDIEVESQVKDFLNDLKQNELMICKAVNCMPEKWKSQIYEYEKKQRMGSLPAGFFSKSSFDEIYTFEYSDWNRGCIVRDGEPSALINFVLITDKHIGLGFKHGGYGVSKFFEVFVIEGDTVSNHWIRFMESSKLGDLTYELLEGDFKVVK